MIEEKGTRIAKVLARVGLCSRREAERWIEAGRVSVEGMILSTPAYRVKLNDKISVDGRVIPLEESPRLWKYHKPKGLLTTNKDPEGRPTVFERLPKTLPRVISVGRLDLNSEGLLLLTNDGSLARRLELPKMLWSRRYKIRVYGNVDQERLDSLKSGIVVSGIRYAPIDAKIESALGSNSWLNITLKEGKNREIRRVMASLGLEVNRLIRVSFGPFQLGKLSRGNIIEMPPKVLRENLQINNSKNRYMRKQN